MSTIVKFPSMILSNNIKKFIDIIQPSLRNNKTQTIYLFSLTWPKLKSPFVDVETGEKYWLYSSSSVHHHHGDALLVCVCVCECIIMGEKDPFDLAVCIVHFASPFCLCVMVMVINVCGEFLWTFGAVKTFNLVFMNIICLFKTLFQVAFSSCLMYEANTL